MRTALALRRDDAWTRHVSRMVGLSTAVHVGLFVVVIGVGAWLAAHRPPPLVAYSVELTDLPGTGGRLPGGPGRGLIGRSATPAAKNPGPGARDAAAPKSVPPPEAAKPAEVAPAKPAPPPPAKPVEAAPKPVAPTPVAKEAPKPKPVAKPEVKKEAVPKPEAKPKPEPKKAEPAKEPQKEPPKPEAAAESPKQPTAATKPAEPAAAKPAAAPATPAAKSASSGTQAATDDYANAAKRFRDRMAAAGTGAGAAGDGVAGGGPGGGVLGSGGDGRGGGQLKSLEWVAYRQRVIDMVKERWSNAIKRPGLVTTVRFRIAPDGTVSGAAVVRASGNPIYDQTAVAAVERVQQLPPPPAAYANEFSQFEINFYGDETGGVS